MRMWRRRQWRINAPPPPFYLLIVAEMNASVALLVSRESRPRKRGRWRNWGLTHRRDNRSFNPPYEGLGLDDVGEFDTMFARFRVPTVYGVALCIGRARAVVTRRPVGGGTRQLAQAARTRSVQGRGR